MTADVGQVEHEDSAQFAPAVFRLGPRVAYRLRPSCLPAQAGFPATSARGFASPPED